MGRKKRLPSEPFEATIESLSHEGRGIAHLDSKVTFIDGALPGERVRFLYTYKSRRHDEGKVIEVLEAAPDRVEPRCPHFGVCGGCSLQHLAPEAQIAFKQASLAEQLQRLGGVEPRHWLPPLTGPLWGYRRKARLGVRWVEKKGKVLVGFRERGNSFVADLTRCEVLISEVGERIEALSELIGGLEQRAKIAQIEVAAGDQLITLVLRNLTPLSEADRARLIDFSRESGIQLQLQPGGIDSVTDLWPTPQKLNYRLDQFDVGYHFRATDFTQVNGDINAAMVNRALELLELQSSDRVLDLFCGLGNFTLPLARHAAHAVGVEGDAELINRAALNAQENGIDNAEFARFDLTQSVLEQSWAQARYDKILLDPPRSGARELMPILARFAPQRLVYVSCHPATLARDLGILVNDFGWRLEKAGVMDMFPHTAHVESIAQLSPPVATERQSEQHSLGAHGASV